jgi:hypothetical protein
VVFLTPWPSINARTDVVRSALDLLASISPSLATKPTLRAERIPNAVAGTACCRRLCRLKSRTVSLKAEHIHKRTACGRRPEILHRLRSSSGNFLEGH